VAFLSKYTCRWRELAFGAESRGDLSHLPREPSLCPRACKEERLEGQHQFQQAAFSAVLHWC
jgi:hypothetical protein